ncbi:hypothetical protein B0J13DRAFT_35327 [Dactylonectria estremocensis]|uniref:Peptidase metallopeptidase domain-containing protein n=1 Tax=Dactylonectria estremocensis TaxID=1079267 RepID=A0A9P9JIZ7_9HYPO|nr:hypothetical protein B0J13DRAFT_35327 [Dactylonectria estremocensis]
MFESQDDVSTSSEDEEFDELMCTAYEEIDDEFNDLHKAVVPGLAPAQPEAKIVDRVFNKPIFWKTGQKLRIGFLGGTPWQKGEVKKYAPEWTIYANLDFEFVDNEPYDITIDFKPGRSFSLLGTESHKRARASPPQASMNLGWVKKTTKVQRYRSTILHEFGHALGRTHEHQNELRLRYDDANNIVGSWVIPKIYAAYAKKGWSQQRVNTNLLAYCKGQLLTDHNFDRDSIMVYAFPEEFFEGGEAIVRKHELSYYDKGAMFVRYPGRDTQSLPKDFAWQSLTVQPINGVPFISTRFYVSIPPIN